MERKSEKETEYTYHDIPAVGDEIPDLGDPELLDLGREGQIVTQVGNLQVKHNKKNVLHAKLATQLTYTLLIFYHLIS